MQTEAELTKPAIRTIFERERCRASALFAHWEHPFTALSFNRARRSYGHAHADGRIVLSNTFVGTSATTDLEDTIRHELAHLIAGIRFKHGPRWQQVAASLGARPRASGRSESSELHEKMSDAPFTLIAVMRDGEERAMRRVFRRARRYVDYRYGKRGQRYHIGGDFIERFEYLDHRE
ncbi:MAG: hypothetical protein ACI8RN_002274 [Glaciecola sp.]|uniref:SprT-like domain-containing protein n=1 Tax=Congregibacter sp. TaxID=2744308 RepID=UPI0039E296CC